MVPSDLTILCTLSQRELFSELRQDIVPLRPEAVSPGLPLRVPRDADVLLVHRRLHRKGDRQRSGSDGDRLRSEAFNPQGTIRLTMEPRYKVRLFSGTLSKYDFTPSMKEQN